MAIELFQLRAKLMIPDVLFAEELEERHAHLRRLGLDVRPLLAEKLVDPVRLRAYYSTLCDLGRRLPWNQVDRQLAELGVGRK